MHTFDAGGGLRIFFNSDLSGEVVIARADESRPHQVAEEMRVPGEALAEFVAEVVRSQRIARLEDATWREVLGLEGEDHA